MTASEIFCYLEFLKEKINVKIGLECLTAKLSYSVITTWLCIFTATLIAHVESLVKYYDYIFLYLSILSVLGDKFFSQSVDCA